MENAVEGRLLALEYILKQLVRDLPKERQDALYDEAIARFTGHHHRPGLDSEAIVVVKNAYGRPGPD